MPPNYFYTFPQSNYVVVGSQDDQITYLTTRITNNTLTKNHGALSYTPPASTYLTGESFEHTGYNGSRWIYAVALYLDSRTWDFDPDSVSPSFTDRHFTPRLLRLDPSDLSLDSIVDLAPTEPTVSSLSKDFYRNATYANGGRYSANLLDTSVDPATDTQLNTRGTSTDGLAAVGRPPLGYIADAQADFFGVVVLDDDWAFPLVAYSNQVWGVNLVTGSRKELLGFPSGDGATSIASLEQTTDPLDPPWGAGFAPLTFSQKLYNVLGGHGDGLLAVQEETQNFTLDVRSAFGSKSITKTLDTGSGAPHPSLSPAFGWPAPNEGTGRWTDWWVTDSGGAFWPGVDTTAIETTIDDTEHSLTGVGSGLVAGLYLATAGATVGNLGQTLFPPRAFPPFREASAPPHPGTTGTAAECTALIAQMKADFTTAAGTSSFTRWKQTSSSIRYIFLEPSTLDEKSCWTPTNTRTDALVDPYILRGASIAEYEDNVPVAEDEFDVDNYPGFYKPLERTPPSGYIGGGEGTLAQDGYSQFVHTIQEVSPPSGFSAPRYSFTSMDNGPDVNWDPGDPGGIRLELASGTTTPIANAMLFGSLPHRVMLTTIYAASPDGKESGTVPLPFHGGKYVSDGLRMIFLPRCATSFRHVLTNLTGQDSVNEATRTLHKIVCIEPPASGNGEWSQVWEIDTYSLMEPECDSGDILETSGDCTSCGILTNGFLYCIVRGGLGQSCLKINVSTGAILANVLLAGPGENSLLSVSSTYYRDNFIISNRLPLGIDANGFWRFNPTES